MDAARPQARLVAVAGNKIAFVGDDDDVARLKGPGTKAIDCGGQTVVPGFNDAPCHIFSLMRKLADLDLSPAAVSSITDIKAKVRERAARTPPGKWISGGGYNEFYLAEKRHPTRADLDAAALEHPVVLAHRSLHAAVLNSRALALAGLDEQTPEPPGVLFERDLETGRLTGLLYEMLGFIREKVLPKTTPDEMEALMRQAGQHYLSSGITSLQDATITNDLGRWQALRGYIDSGALRSRVNFMVGYDGLPAFLDAGMKTGSGDERLKLGAVKIILSQATGQIRPTQPQLNGLALLAHDNGFQVAIHCFEPEMVAAAIGALEYVNAKAPIAGRRHRLEHGAECPPELLARLAKLGVAVVTQPGFIYYHGERYLATMPPQQVRWLYQVRAWLESGLVVAGSSDAPVAPDNPLEAIGAAVTRRAAAGQRVVPEEAITAEQALALYTKNAAYASFEENIKGALTPGRLADIVVLSDDPRRVPPEKIKDIKVRLTVVDGKVAWEG